MNSTIKWPSWFVLTRHWLSLVGVALVTAAVISWLFVLPLRIRGHEQSVCRDCHFPDSPGAVFPEILRTLGLEERISKLQKK